MARRPGPDRPTTMKSNLRRATCSLTALEQEYLISRILYDARILNIFEGAAEI